MGSDVTPTLKTWERFSPNPRRITAYCNTFLEVNCIPALSFCESLRIIPSRSPINKPRTGPPMIGNKFPRNHARRDISIAILNPSKNSFIFIHLSP